MPLVATLLMACGPSGSSFKIEGQFEDMVGSEMYIYNLSENNPRIDTIHVQNGAFEYKGECDDVIPYILVFPNAVEQVIFVAPGKAVTYEASISDLKNYTVKGTGENKLLNEFRKQTSSMKASQMQEAAGKFIEANASSPVAIYLFDRYYIQDAGAKTQELNRILGILKKVHPKNTYLLNIEGKLKVYQKGLVGKILPDVTLYKQKRVRTKLWKDAPSSPACILFWASWNPGYTDYLSKVRELMRNVDEGITGRVIFISLDSEYYRYENESRHDSILGIEHFCDGLALESPVVKSFGVPDVPYYYITDKNHKVITSGDDISKLIKDMKKYLKD